MLCFFDVREHSRGAAKTEPDLYFSNQILTENTEMEKYQSDLSSLQQEMTNLQEANEQGVEKKLEIKKQSDDITTLEQDIKSNQLQNKNRIDGKETSLKETILSAATKQRQKLEKQQEMIEQIRNNHSKEMLEDAARFQELQAQKDQERAANQAALEKLRSNHAQKMAAETETHRKNIEIKKSQIDQKKREILQIIEENEEIIQQITQDTAFEIEDINNKNKNNKT